MIKIFIGFRIAFSNIRSHGTPFVFVLMADPGSERVKHNVSSGFLEGYYSSVVLYCFQYFAPKIIR